MGSILFMNFSSIALLISWFLSLNSLNFAKLNSFRLIINFLLSAILLIANSCFAIGKMTCLHSGSVELRLGKAESCDLAEIKDSQIQEPCCELLNFNLTPDSHLFSSVYKFNSPGFILLMRDFFFSIAVTSNIFIRASFIPNSFSNPPPKWPDFFSYISLFRIWFNYFYFLSIVIK